MPEGSFAATRPTTDNGTNEQFHHRLARGNEAEFRLLAENTSERTGRDDT